MRRYNGAVILFGLKNWFFLIIASGIYAGYALGDHMSGVTLSDRLRSSMVILFLMEGVGDSSSPSK